VDSNPDFSRRLVGFLKGFNVGGQAPAINPLASLPSLRDGSVSENGCVAVEQLELFRTSFPMDSRAFDFLKIVPPEVQARVISTFKPPAVQADYSKIVMTHIKFCLNQHRQTASSTAAGTGVQAIETTNPSASFLGGAGVQAIETSNTSASFLGGAGVALYGEIGPSLLSNAGILALLQQTQLIQQQQEQQQQQLSIEAPKVEQSELEKRLETFKNTYPMDSRALDFLLIVPQEVQERVLGTFKPPAIQADYSKIITAHVKFCLHQHREQLGLGQSQATAPSLFTSSTVLSQQLDALASSNTVSQDQLESFRCSYPMDDRAYEYLTMAPADIQKRVVSTFNPPGIQADYSKMVTAHVKFCLMQQKEQSTPDLGSPPPLLALTNTPAVPTVGSVGNQSADLYEGLGSLSGTSAADFTVGLGGLSVGSRPADLALGLGSLSVGNRFADLTNGLGGISVGSSPLLAFGTHSADLAASLSGLGGLTGNAIGLSGIGTASLSGIGTASLSEIGTASLSGVGTASLGGTGTSSLSGIATTSLSGIGTASGAFPRIAQAPEGMMSRSRLVIGMVPARNHVSLEELELFRSMYPMDERAFDYLKIAPPEVQERVIATFNVSEVQSDYSRAITAHVNFCLKQHREQVPDLIALPTGATEEQAVQMLIDFRQRYPTDERAWNYLLQSSGEVKHRVLTEFCPPQGVDGDYSKAVTSYIRRCRDDEKSKASNPAENLTSVLEQHGLGALIQQARTHGHTQGEGVEGSAAKRPRTDVGLGTPTDSSAVAALASQFYPFQWTPT